VDPDTADFRKRLGLKTSHIRFLRRFKRNGRILDVGCGNGYFLAACRERGYEVQGLDVSEWAVQYATHRLGLPVAIGEMEKVEFERGSFDVITMWHFLEHTPNPIEALLKARTWMKEDGLLVVEVPNYGGTDARREWQNWVGWSLPYHFYHFTPRALKKLLERCGFSIVRTKYYHSETVKADLRRFLRLAPFARLIARLYSGHSMAMAALPNHSTGRQEAGTARGRENAGVNRSSLL
jgi:SAM-dependent methyltransferase